MKIPILYHIGQFFIKRSGLANPESWLIDALGGNKAASGVRVNENTALNSTAVLACVRVLAETIASLPLFVYRRLDKGKEKATEHPLYFVLHDMPNPEMTSFTFRETLMGHLAIWGNAYVEIVRDRAGRVRELWPLRPDKTWPERDQITQKLRYKLILPNGTGAILPADRVLHIPGLGFDGLVGYSPVKLARDAIGLSLAAEEFGARFFSNGAKPGGVLEHPAKLSEEAQKRLRQSWNEMHQGLDKQHRIAILEEGMTYKQIGIPPEDAQFLETRKFQLNEIARIYRVPPHMIGDLERATYSNIEQQSIDFVVNTIRPWLVRWEQAINSKLLTQSEREEYFVEFKVDGLLRGDIESRYKAYATARQWGWMSANDVRELENMNPIEGGDTYLIPLNMIPADGSGSDTEGERNIKKNIEVRAIRAANVRRGIANSYKTVISETVARILRREKADIMREAEKYFGKRNLSYELFEAWLLDFYHDHEEFVKTQMHPVLRGLAEAINTAANEEIGREPRITQQLEQFIDDYVNGYQYRHIGLSVQKLRKALEKGAESGDYIGELKKEFDKWNDRPDTIAQEEAVRKSNAVTLLVYKQAGIPKVRWVATGKNCPYCNALDGKVVRTDTTFLMAGETFRPEGAETPLIPDGNIKHPPAHVGCDCHLSFSLF